MSNEVKKVGSVKIDFMSNGEPKFEFEGEIDPTSIWTLGVHLKLAYDNDYIMKRRVIDLENQEKKKKELAEKARIEAKAKEEAEKKAIAEAKAKEKAEKELAKKKRELVRLENEKTELEKLLKKAEEQESPDIDKVKVKLNQIKEKIAKAKKGL